MMLAIIALLAVLLLLVVEVRATIARDSAASRWTCQAVSCQVSVKHMQSTLSNVSEGIVT